MNDRKLGDEQGPGRGICPVCEGDDLCELSVRRSPPLLRCQSCRLAFRAEPVYDIVDHRMGDEELERLGEGRLPLYMAELESLQAQLQMGTLLDVGCGNGLFARWMGQQGWQVTALDSSGHLCHHARGSDTRNVVRGLAQDLPFSSHRFDVVTLWDVIDHLEKPIPALIEARRVLRPGGTVYLRVRNGPVHLAMRRSMVVPTAASVVHNLLFSGSTLTNALKSAGFVDVEANVSPLTRGNPYASPSWWRSSGFRALKRVWSGTARLSSRLTHRRLLLAPSIRAIARRPNE